MSEAPERIWAYHIRDGYGLWRPLDEKHDTIEYVRADRIEELEERLKAARDDANEAETYAAEVEDNLAKAMDVDLIEQAISDVLSEGGTYRDAAEYVACTTIAELKGEK
jgi:hypothetical protein